MKIILATILCTFGFHNYGDERSYATNGKWWKIEHVEKLNIKYVLCERCSKVKIEHVECGKDLNKKQRKYVYKACGEIVRQYVDTFQPREP